MRVLFIGCVEFSKVLLEEIFNSRTVEICGVVTKMKSKINSDFYDLSEVATKYDVESFIFEPKKNEDAMISWIMNKSPDIIFCFGWSHLIPQRLIDYPQFGIVGYHPAELPYNRGRHPIIWALVLGLKQTASTFFMIETGADTGDIVDQEKVNIAFSDDANSLYWKLNEIAKIQIKRICEDLAQNKLNRLPQNHELANVWRKRSDKDGLIDWRMSSEALYNLIRGLTRPYPGAYFLNGDDRVVVWKAKIILDSFTEVNIEPGKILLIEGKTFTVKTSTGSLEIIDYEGQFTPVVGEYL